MATKREIAFDVIRARLVDELDRRRKVFLNGGVLTVMDILQRMLRVTAALAMPKPHDTTRTTT